MNIEMRHLRYFVAVAEEASFTAAAQRAHVSQQVLSTQIRQLEDAVGARLLERTSRGVMLTPAGAAFLGYARDAMSAVERGVTAARNAANVVSGRLTVGLSAATGGTVRTRVLAAFERAYPEVTVQLLAYDLAQPAAGLLDHGTDVALLRPPVSTPGLAVERIAEEPRVFVLPTGHALASRPSLGLADVAASCRLALEAPADAVPGNPAFIIAAADTVMSRPSSELLAEVYPGVPLTREVPEFGTLLAIDRAREVLGFEPAHSWRDYVSPAAAS